MAIRKPRGTRPKDGFPNKREGDSARMQKFAEIYAVTHNPTEAAIESGYSPKSARMQAYRLLTKQSVLDEIAIQEKKLGKDRVIKSRKILKELARLCFSDIRRLFDEHGALKPMAEWDDDIAACVAAVDVVQRIVKTADGDIAQEHIKKIKLWDKGSSIEKAMRHLGLLMLEKDKDEDGNKPSVTVIVQKFGGDYIEVNQQKQIEDKRAANEEER